MTTSNLSKKQREKPDVLDGRILGEEPPVAPPMRKAKVTPVGESVRLWKPKGEEFFGPKYDELRAKLGPVINVCYDVEDETQDGVEGHSLICTAV